MARDGARHRRRGHPPAGPDAQWSGHVLFPFNGPSWSLFYELIVNLLFAISIRWLSWRNMLIALPVLAVLLWLTVTRHDVPGPGWRWAHVDAALARVGFCFLAGVAVYRLRTIFRLPQIPYVFVFCGLLAVFWGPVPDIWRNQYDALAAIFIMPLLVALGAQCRATGIAARVFTTLGSLSFGVYVLRVPILEGLRIVLGKLHIEAAGDLLVFVLAGLALIASALATRWIDRPVRAVLMRAAASASIRAN